MSEGTLRQRLEESASTIKSSLGRETLPETLVVLGSGFKGFEASLLDARTIALSSVKGAPVPRVEGHGASLVVGRLPSGKDVAVLTGRVHLYEGYNAEQVVYPVRVLAALGVRR